MPHTCQPEPLRIGVAPRQHRSFVWELLLSDTVDFLLQGEGVKR